MKTWRPIASTRQPRTCEVGRWGTNSSRHERTTETPASCEGLSTFLDDTFVWPRRGNLLVRPPSPTALVTASRGPGRASHRGHCSLLPFKRHEQLQKPAATRASRPYRTASSASRRDPAPAEARAVVRIALAPITWPSSSRRSTRYVTLDSSAVERVERRPPIGRALRRAKLSTSSTSKRAPDREAERAQQRVDGADRGAVRADAQSRQRGEPDRVWVRLAPVGDRLGDADRGFALRRSPAW